LDRINIKRKRGENSVIGEVGEGSVWSRGMECCGILRLKEI
jgi:hypothetical protein